MNEQPLDGTYACTKTVVSGSARVLTEQNVNSLLRGVKSELNERGNSKEQNTEEGADAIGVSHGVQ